MLINLYGFLEGDFTGRVIVINSDSSVQSLADRLQAWGPEFYPLPLDTPTVTNELGNVLASESTLTEAGLTPGDLFRVTPTDL